MNWKTKYSFWREPEIDGLIYRYNGGKSQPRIDRSPISPCAPLAQRRAFRDACRWEVWKEFEISDEGEAECKREWRRLCDAADRGTGLACEKTDHE